MIQFEHICAARHIIIIAFYKLMKEKSSEGWEESFKLIPMHLSKV